MLSQKDAVAFIIRSIPNKLKQWRRCLPGEHGAFPHIIRVDRTEEYQLIVNLITYSYL